MVLKLLSLLVPHVERSILGSVYPALVVAYGCGKNDHKVRDCPNIVAKGRNARQAPYSGPSVDGQARNRFYALQANKEANPDEGAGKSLFLVLCWNPFVLV